MKQIVFVSVEANGPAFCTASWFASGAMSSRLEEDAEGGERGEAARQEACSRFTVSLNFDVSFRSCIASCHGHVIKRLSCHTEISGIEALHRQFVFRVRSYLSS